MCSDRVMLFCALVLLGTGTQACQDHEVPRDRVLAWVRGRVLEGLGVEEAPVSQQRVRGPERGEEAGAGRGPRRASRARRTAWVERGPHRHELHPENSLIILFPSSDLSCTRSGSSGNSSHFTYYFQPSMNHGDVTVTSAHFWFYAGHGVSANSSAPLFVLTSEQRLLRAADAPSTAGSDGWVTYRLGRDVRTAASHGPFALQVRCATCECRAADEPDKTPFLHLSARLPRGTNRSPRASASAAPRSSNAVELLLQRHLQGGPPPEYGDCRREEVVIGFEELGWEHWIVRPKALTFRYCRGDCAAANRTVGARGRRQCCAPVPGTMTSLSVTTTSDGGNSFQLETLPNIMPEECACL